jgi:large subunit ribosomal protein L19e
MAKQSRISNPRRRIASAIMKCGSHRVWFSPDHTATIKQAITRNDIRKLIKKGLIKKHHVKPKTKTVSRKQRSGSRKGRRKARTGKKSQWFKIVRPQRKLLKEMKTEDKLTDGSYRKLYGKVKAGVFRSKAHLKTFMEDKKMVKNNG